MKFHNHKDIQNHLIDYLRNLRGKRSDNLIREKVDPIKRNKEGEKIRKLKIKNPIVKQAILDKKK